MTADNSPSRSLVAGDAGALSTLGPEIQDAANYAQAEKAAATRRAYRSDFALFRSWCEVKLISALPASPDAAQADTNPGPTSPAYRADSPSNEIAEVASMSAFGTKRTS
jgi:hypothetical protein